MAFYGVYGGVVVLGRAAVSRDEAGTCFSHQGVPAQIHKYSAAPSMLSSSMCQLTWSGSPRALSGNSSTSIGA